MSAPANTLTDNSGFKKISDTTVISTLDGSLGLLAITGIDSAKFLQGQLTCNLQDITPQQSRPGAHCTHKGRMVANFRLLQQGEQHYLFVLPQETLGALQKSLTKYIVFSKAKLQEVSSEYILRGISGNHAAQCVTQFFGAAPEALHAQHSNENGTVICVDTREPRFLCIVPQTHAASVDSSLPSSAHITDDHYWNWLDIRDGIGFVRTETIEEFIPQMLNLQLLDGISFTKGCYTGQEIVARMQYRGTLKKAMYRISGNGMVPTPNTTIFQDGNTQAVGHIVNAESIGKTESTGDAQWEALAVINHDAMEHSLHLDNTQALRVLPLPYAVHATQE